MSTDRIVGVYESLAKGGYGAVTVGATCVRRDGLINERMLGLLLAGASAALAGIAGMCLALSFTLAPSQIYTWVGVVFAVVMIGGLANPLGALIAGAAIGVAEAITMALIAPAWAPLVSFSLLITVLLTRPDKV